ncbi:MAG: class I SAM-dependent methyltransferase [Chloroflexaceae bacterium]|nr:class I SAM-dependent methyltransferase [Chloroflexaceae bacterium]
MQHLQPYQVRGPQSAPRAFWGTTIQPQRWSAIQRYTPPGVPILDLGAGRGAYVEALGSLGFSVVGVDVYRYPEWHDRPQGIFVNAAASDLPFDDKRFHTTISFEVLEHCPEPHLVLREIARCTTDRLIFSVPNCNLDNALRKYNLALFHWTDPTHCNFFTKDTLQSFLVQENFTVLEMTDAVQIIPNNYFWDTLRIPRRAANVMKKVCKRLNLVETYWSSILVVAEIPGSR